MVQEEKLLQSKKVKSVATKSGPFSNLTDNFDVKCDSPLGMRGRRSFLKDIKVRQWKMKRFSAFFIPWGSTGHTSICAGSICH